MDLTTEARDGYDHGTRIDCPFYETSPAAMAWHLGKHLAADDQWRGRAPTPGATLDDPKRLAVMSGRGDTFSIRGRKQILLARFQWHEGNRFTELRTS